MPQRIQRKRTKGWRMPEGAVYVGRPTKWGNPFTVAGHWIVWAAVALGFRGDVSGRRQAAVTLYRSWLTKRLPPIARSKRNCGAITYDDGTPEGRTVETSDQVQGLAGTMCGIYEPPALPERPSVSARHGPRLLVSA